jgi:hypothetical protein
MGTVLCCQHALSHTQMNIIQLLLVVAGSGSANNCVALLETALLLASLAHAASMRPQS